MNYETLRVNNELERVEGKGVDILTWKLYDISFINKSIDFNILYIFYNSRIFTMVINVPIMFKNL